MSTTAEQENPAGAIVVAALAGKPSFGDIPLGCIRASKTNPRKRFDVTDLNDLAKSIQQQGVAQPILVRPIEQIDGVTYFEIVAGERRFRASGIAKMPTVPAIVRELSDQAAYEIQVLENLQRVDLHPLEEAEGFEVMMTTYGDTAEQLAEKVGKSKAYIYASLKLCALDPAARAAFYNGHLTKSTALLVARIPVKVLQVKCTAEITSTHRGVLSTRAAAEHIAINYMLNLSKATFQPEDLDLCANAGACSVCPKRAGNQPIIFADVAADVCTDPVCFKTKSDAHGAKTKQVAIASGKTVISGTAAKSIVPHHNRDIQSGYVSLDATNYDDEKRRTYRQLLGKNDGAVALLESPHDSSLLEVVKLADIKQQLVDKGVGSQQMASQAREKEQEAAAKLEREYRSQLFMEIHHSTLLVNLVDRDLRLVACQLFDRMPSNVRSTMLVMSLHGWTNETLCYPDYTGKLRAAVDALTPAQLNQFIRDCVLSRELDVNTYTSTSKDDPRNLLAYAAHAKVDAKKIRSALDATANAKANAKKQAAETKAAKDKNSAKPASAVPAKSATGGKSTPKPPAAKPKAPAKSKAVTAPAKKFPGEPVAVGIKESASEKATRIAAWPFPTTSREAMAPATPAAPTASAEASKPTQETK